MSGPDEIAPFGAGRLLKMRISRRTTVQLTLFFLVVIFLNGYITVITDKKGLLEGEKSDHSNIGLQSKQDLRKRSLSEDGLKEGDDTDTFKGSKNKLDSLTGNSRNGETKISAVQKNSESKSNRIDRTHPVQSSKVAENNKSHPKPQSPIDESFLKLTEGYLKNNELDRLSHSRQTELSDIFISVKTTKKFHLERIQLLLDTWVQLAQDETYFFTDEEDEHYKGLIPNGHLINTNCSAVHNRVALCCKMSVEYDYFIASKKRWFCHVDDDTYINIPKLSRLLQKYNHTEDWYLGKPSLNHPIEIGDPESPGQKFAFWFATGGAGFCLSRGLALKMMPFTAGGRLKTACAQIRLPDDCTIGFIIYYHLRKQMTSVQELHSHLEGLWLIKPSQLDQQITLSYIVGVSDKFKNIVQVTGFNETHDPSRFRSIHCRLFPYQKGCPSAPR